MNNLKIITFLSLVGLTSLACAMSPVEKEALDRIVGEYKTRLIVDADYKARIYSALLAITTNGLKAIEPHDEKLEAVQINHVIRELQTILQIFRFLPKNDFERLRIDNAVESDQKNGVITRHQIRIFECALVIMRARARLDNEFSVEIQKNLFKAKL